MENSDYQINLKDYIDPILKRIKLIVGFTIVVTILSILYAMTLTPSYEVNALFKEPNESSILKLNKFNYQINPLFREESKRITEQTKLTVFKSFLTKLSSPNYQKKFFEDKKATQISNLVRFKDLEIEISSPLPSQSLISNPYSITIKGGEPGEVVKYLNHLIQKTNAYTINTIANLNTQSYMDLLEEIAIERKLLIDKAENSRQLSMNSVILEIKRLRSLEAEKRLNEIVLLSDAASIARSLGVTENNFKLISSDNVNSSLTIAIGETKNVPQWYLYGEKALLKRIELLENRNSDDPFIPELASLLNEAEVLENSSKDFVYNAKIIKLDIKRDRIQKIYESLELKRVDAVTIDKTATIKPIYPKRRIIVIVSFIGSLLISILLVLFINLLKPEEENPA